MSVDLMQIKARAREMILTSRPRVLYASLIYVALLTLVSFLSAQVIGVTNEEANRFISYAQAGSFEQALNYYYDSLMPEPSALLIYYLLQIAVLFVAVGLTAFLFNTVRGRGAVFGNLLDGFGPYFRLVLLRLLIALFVGLWSMLFLIPGIVAVYRYSMAPYLLLDHPEYSLWDCIQRSKAMTRGQKRYLFLLDLSFLFYILLSMIRYVGFAVLVWYLPYRETSFLLFYDAIRARDETPDL